MMLSSFQIFCALKVRAHNMTKYITNNHFILYLIVLENVAEKRIVLVSVVDV